MPRDNINTHAEASPNFDGERESIINNPLATENSKVGVQFNNKMEFGEEKNPFKFTPKENPMMARFEKLMRGNKKQD